jgi:hypothetical protein
MFYWFSLINTYDMEDSAKLLESLLERAEDYGKTSLELAKLKTIDKTADIVSSLVPISVVILLTASFLLFLNLGLAFWLGEVLGKPYYGFFIIAGFYLVVAVIIHFLLNNWIKRLVGNYFVKHVLK